MMDEKYQQAIRYWTLAQPVVSAYVSAVVRDFRDRDDVLQAISVAILESFDSYDPSRPFLGWAMGVARNQIGTYLRERRRNRLTFDAETIEQLAVAFEQVEPEKTRSLDHLHECLSKLEGRARRLCDLRYQNDLKPAAIASLLGMTPNTVAKSLQRIRDQLRQCIERNAASDGARPL
jgi:RNA polymerase sigma-70 factor (ECF subfamily)